MTRKEVVRSVLIGAAAGAATVVAIKLAERLVVRIIKNNSDKLLR